MANLPANRAPGRPAPPLSGRQRAGASVGYPIRMVSAVAPSIYTIGHSNHSLEHFLQLLRDSDAQAVADVRSQPYSRYCPHFSREPLQRSLQAAAIPYVFLGEEFGGRPKGAEFYDAEGHVLFSLLAKTDLFITGLERLERGAATHRIALLCSEEDPDHCHRHHLVGRALLHRSVSSEQRPPARRSCLDRRVSPTRR